MSYEKTTWLDGITPISANNMNKIENGIAQAGMPFASYMAFCGNVNVEMLDAAFGKNNDTLVTGLGIQLAMYGWFKGDSKTTFPFTSLISKNRFTDLLADIDTLQEILMTYYIPILIKTSTYAYTLYTADAIKLLIRDIIMDLAGISTSYASLGDLLLSSTEISLIANSDAVTIAGNYYPAISYIATSASIVSAYSSNIGKLLTPAGRAAFWANSNAISGWLALYQSGSSGYGAITNGFLLSVVGYNTTVWFYINIDVTDLNTLYYSAQYDRYASYGGSITSYISIGGVTVSTRDVGALQNITVNLSGYTGVVKLGFGHKGGAGSSTTHIQYIYNTHFY